MREESGLASNWRTEHSFDSLIDLCGYFGINLVQEVCIMENALLKAVSRFFFQVLAYYLRGVDGSYLNLKYTQYYAKTFFFYSNQVLIFFLSTAAFNPVIINFSIIVIIVCVFCIVYEICSLSMFSTIRARSLIVLIIVCNSKLLMVETICVIDPFHY